MRPQRSCISAGVRTSASAPRLRSTAVYSPRELQRNWTRNYTLGEYRVRLWKDVLLQSRAKFPTSPAGHLRASTYRQSPWCSVPDSTNCRGVWGCDGGGRSFICVCVCHRESERGCVTVLYVYVYIFNYIKRATNNNMCSIIVLLM